MNETREAFPSVLVVTNTPFGLGTAIGATLSALFEGWPRDRIAQIYAGDAEPESEVCRRFYRLRGWAQYGGPLLWRQARVHWDVLTGRADTALLRGGISQTLDRWLTESPPDLVLCVFDSIGGADVAMRVSARYGVPLAVYIPDDWMVGWPSNVYGRSRPVLDAIAHRLLLRTARRLIERSSRWFGISQPMREEYLRRYGVAFEPVHNGVDLGAWPPRPAQDDLMHRPMRIVYSGSLLHYGQADAVADVCDAVERLCRDGISVELEIFSGQAADPEVRRRFARPPAVRLRPLVPASAIAANLQSADLLLLPVNFDATSREFVRLSMPAKLAEYLASGTPLLAYGPPETAQARLLRDEEAAAIVDERDPARLARTLRTLRDDRDLRERLGGAARRCAEHHFDVRVLRARFQAALRTTRAIGTPGAR